MLQSFQILNSLEMIFRNRHKVFQIGIQLVHLGDLIYLLIVAGFPFLHFHQSFIEVVGSLFDLGPDFIHLIHFLFKSNQSLFDFFDCIWIRLAPPILGGDIIDGSLVLLKYLTLPLEDVIGVINHIESGCI